VPDVLLGLARGEHPDEVLREDEDLGPVGRREDVGHRRRGLRDLIRRRLAGRGGERVREAVDVRAVERLAALRLDAVDDPELGGARVAAARRGDEDDLVHAVSVHVGQRGAGELPVHIGRPGRIDRDAQEGAVRPRPEGLELLLRGVPVERPEIPAGQEDDLVAGVEVDVPDRHRRGDRPPAERRGVDQPSQVVEDAERSRGVPVPQIAVGRGGDDLGHAVTVQVADGRLPLEVLRLLEHRRQPADRVRVVVPVVVVGAVGVVGVDDVGEDDDLHPAPAVQIFDGRAGVARIGDVVRPAGQHRRGRHPEDRGAPGPLHSRAVDRGRGVPEPVGVGNVLIPEDPHVLDVTGADAAERPFLRGRPVDGVAPQPRVRTGVQRRLPLQGDGPRQARRGDRLRRIARLLPDHQFARQHELGRGRQGVLEDVVQRQPLGLLHPKDERLPGHRR